MKENARILEKVIYEMCLPSRAPGLSLFHVRVYLHVRDISIQILCLLYLYPRNHIPERSTCSTFVHEVTKPVMVNLVCQFDWAKGCLGGPGWLVKQFFLNVSVRVFLGEISNWIHRRNREHPHQRGQTSSSLLRF